MPEHKLQRASRTARLFVVVVCLIIVLLEAWSAWRAYEVVIDESARDTSNMALALVQQADQSFKEIDVVLQGVQEHLHYDGADAPGRQRTHDFMVSSVAALPQLAMLTVYDETGLAISSSQSNLEQRYIQDDYFLHHQRVRTDHAYIGKPMRSRVSGQWVATMSRRVNHDDGSFAGVVVADIDLSHFQRYYEQFSIGRNGAILFGLNEGTVIFRQPLLSYSIGLDISKSALMTEYLAKSEHGSFEMHSPRDDIVRVTSFQRCKLYPTFVAVALAKDDILEDWTRRLWIRGIVVLLLLIIISYGGNRLVSQVARRETAELEAITARTELERLYRTLEAQSQKDGLTDVFNRRYFDLALTAELSRLNRSGESLSLIMVDVDHFKRYNDTYGHAAGDICLKQVAAALGSVARRQGDIVARYGGEEFALILPNCNAASAVAISSRLVQAVRKLDIPHEGSPMGHVTISVGAASLASGKGTQVDARELIDIADAALYRAKEQGRDRAIQHDYPRLAVISDYPSLR
ncbi:sensor domain-containing diguanylate cyclase [uncultured Herbaspirillum sp.]|uniref:sensor domain-containing diguanylate cyclase n=1 Tax=uncultured Herbaspirillum sp. TaxID=160236 RepID=UPI0025847492|nr:sensor domain-containing diguanylate cyclase [uncultured Herbaspirillum sp.]